MSVRSGSRTIIMPDSSLFERFEAKIIGGLTDIANINEKGLNNV